MSRYILDARTAVPHFPGIGRYVSNLASALAPQLTAGEELNLLESPSSRRAIASAPVPQAEGAFQLPGKSFIAPATPFDIRQQWRIPNLLKRLQADNEALYHSPYYLMPYRTRLPTLLTFYDVIPLKFPNSVPARARLFFRLAATLALRAADRVLVISHAARSDLLSFFSIPASKTTVTPLAAGARYRPQPSAEVARIRHQYRLPERFLLYLGINKPHKNLPALVDAYAQTASPHMPPLVIAGAWDNRYPQPTQHAARHELGDAVRFLGPVAERDLPALYSAATLFIFPSLYEGFGLPVLEAMACGTPVACSNTPSLTEIAGDAALNFDPLSVTAIRDAMVELIEDGRQRARRAEQGLTRAGRYSWQATAAATLRCYREMLGLPGKA
ncbi:MAG: glycosyltransferase family 4 protein [Caldilineaceae bacterium SB0675_bin_29]|uniref:Glycosyltransferase family 4 protein n=1 Tax=Caldilineaceae bacterium SB0675_bin_29 TaxID=2605266 RepID=A0A6B1G325_9CHLR|nr:glycosyltransferase family 4 protein [Caldilineaceae bacterium SB0675_bin_29]